MPKIIFCEDDDLTRKVIGIALRNRPYKIYFASDGLTGLALIERMRPDLVFTDFHLPGLTGVELCTALKAQRHLAHIPVILLSGVAVDVTQLSDSEGRRLFAASLAKPFHPSVLRARIDQLLGMPADHPVACP